VALPIRFFVLPQLIERSDLNEIAIGLLLAGEKDASLKSID
jgi:hypothetical protein